MKVWVLQTGEPLHFDGTAMRPMRAMNVADALVDAGHQVVVWSSAFYHQEKRHRTRTPDRVKVSGSLEIQYIPSGGYSANVGIGRLVDHAQLARNLKKLLRRESPPDVTFIGFPPIETAAVMTKWLAHRNSPSLLDLKDQWPELFVQALPRGTRSIGRMLLFPYFAMAFGAIRRASGLSSMADSFLAWGLNIAKRKRSEFDGVFALTSRIAEISPDSQIEASAWWDDQKVLDSGVPRFCFIGSHSGAFDFETIAGAAEILDQRGVEYEIIICGDGELHDKLVERMLRLKSVRVMGWIDRQRIDALAKRSVAALAPYRNVDNFTLNIPNKILDALSLGLPLVTPLRGEVEKIISNLRVGLCYIDGDSESLARCLSKIINEPENTRSMSTNARRAYSSTYSFEKVYPRLVQHLEFLASQ